MEKIVLKAIELENAVCSLRSRVVGMQSAINLGASVEEVNKHYSLVVAASLRVQQLAGSVRSSSFQIAANYHFEYDI